MGGCPPNTYISPKSMGRMHRATSLFNRVFVLNNTSLHKYVDEQYSYEIPKLISEDETWDFAIKMYQDIRIESGSTLTVQCEVRMPVDGKIIIEPGARLIVDGGLITSAHEGYFWSGIEAWGTTSEHQFPANHPAYQGLVVLKNGAVIEHAREGIQTMKPGDWSTVGGVVQVQGTHAQVGGTFRNCRRALSFVKYRNFLPGNPTIPQPNNSYFNYARFEYDNNYRESNYIYSPVTIWGVDGLMFRACAFSNNQTGTLGSSQLGKGIISIDANYYVRGNCNVILPYGTPCPANELDKTEFNGFDHGIHALGGPSSKTFLVRDTEFKSNVCGVYVNGVVGYQVRGCEFEVGGQAVPVLDDPVEFFWEDYHRGVYSTEAWGFAVDDNTLLQVGAHAETEGIVVGYSRDHNDVVFRNAASGLERGYIGEGIAADLDESYTGLRGLQFLCNENNGNGQNFWSRKVDIDLGSNPDDHTIRTNQGFSYRPADNTFDQLPGPVGVSDFEVTTVNGNITYWHRNTGDLVPIHVRQSIDPPCYLGPVPATSAPANNCASKIMRTIPADPGHPSGMAVEPIADHLQDEKLAYGNTRYLYDQLIDGGSTDEVVLEITSAWPQGYWDLRDYLLARSPYLSVEALMQAMEKEGFPDAMRAEVCIANPEATQKEGFIKWMRYECVPPLPEYLIDNIVASWEVKTYRANLEGEMAYHHGEMTQAANMLVHRHQLDEDGAQPIELRAVWQELRSPAGRYAEALTWLEEGDHSAAANVIEAIPLEHKLKAPETLERQRMLDLIGQLALVHASGRNEAQLTPGEVDALELLRGDAYDRPAAWISNLLCFHYERCRAPLTGGTGGGPKALRARLSQPALASAPATLLVHPNPASTWVAFDYELVARLEQAALVLKDLVGREVQRFVLAQPKGQVLWDTRALSPGTYTATMMLGAHPVLTEKLIIRQ